MTLSSEAVREEAVEPDPGTSPQAQAHAQRATSVPTALPLPPVTDTPDDRWPAPDAVRAWLLSRLEAARKRELDLVHGPPGSLGSIHARHQRAAAHWNGALPRNLRLGWGALHTAIAAVLYAALDAAFSPAGALLAVLFIIACWHWL